MRKCKVDLQEMGKVVKCLEKDLKKLKLQRASSSDTQGLRGTLHEAEISKEKVKDLVVKDKDLTDSKELVDEEPKDQDSEDKE